MFFNCTGLTSVVIPDTVTSIGGSVFAGCSSSLVITCGENSCAAGYAAANKIAYRYKDGGEIIYPPKEEESTPGNTGGSGGTGGTGGTGGSGGGQQSGGGNSGQQSGDGGQESGGTNGGTTSSGGNSGQQSSSGGDSSNKGESQNKTIQPVTNTKKPDAATYKISSSSKKTVTYTKTKTTSKTAKVPDTIKVKGKTYKVTSVAEGAFKNNKKIQTVTIGKNVTSIGKNAFSGAKNLKSITLNGNTLKKVGKNAFKSIKKNCKITIQAKNKSQYNKIVKLIKKSGAKNVKFAYKKKK